MTWYVTAELGPSPSQTRLHVSDGPGPGEGCGRSAGDHTHAHAYIYIYTFYLSIYLSTETPIYIHRCIDTKYTHIHIHHNDPRKIMQHHGSFADRKRFCPTATRADTWEWSKCYTQDCDWDVDMYCYWKKNQHHEKKIKNHRSTPANVEDNPFGCRP